ncbi:MAG TPA: helix-turn-helix domain-containing protein [Nitrospiraceae bacterium]|nr:helix-turn-helix domain-containing protein [Nitrospiraceae bacterium]
MASTKNDEPVVDPSPNKVENLRAITPKNIDDFLDRVEWPLLVQTLKECKGLSGLLKRIESALIRRTIKEHGGNKTAAAKFLDRTYRWLRKTETERPGD